MFAKKGMSPLIATVLLIAFAVALGAMIMNWSTDVEPVSAQPETNSCNSVRIELNEVFGKPIFCYQDEKIKFNIVNVGTQAISGIQLRTVDANLKEVKQDLANSKIPIGGTYEQEFRFDKSGKVHVELVPKVVVSGQPQYCINKRIVQDVLPECSN